MEGEEINMSLRQGTSREDSVSVYLDENVKQLLLELQKHWLVDYKMSRERALVEITEMLHQNFLTDQQKIRTELLTQFKEELDNTRREMDEAYKLTLHDKLSELEAQHEQQIHEIKKKQWCINCGIEAIYHCCWNTSYCSTACQESHWQTHRRVCKRKTKNK